ncbi:hypothetical protein HRR83_002636 [Exophiala dermatitidis]|uniref:Uncharacterized protein n=2 Tax=Exophiala dermatitidis TaxID=5970 RepID=H6BZZ2_EXODN|nr:uncharacterized protein HMPREF1120_05189 [Exophiala dermatitidis NIH/UT8656]KAJ4503550.1 hypothetical protein HRR74_009255 [Exophiala dermatitidis]EHY57141.1 hypothetical protein HMPREF1120_05189 [Exophiala dermatitidis NIH/UT8656]KAJ4514550.1 hypothetical protein HRR73_005578 [Exophiala dermatitidis]KAJ4531836.1 hypothetical protein HRR77_009108 [Exophiala dermatitidis]KAJ4537403.1 hypothetical protein HRR76_005412 [Exophiala dermatitidis]
MDLASSIEIWWKSSSEDLRKVLNTAPATVTNHRTKSADDYAGLSFSYVVDKILEARVVEKRLMPHGVYNMAETCSLAQQPGGTPAQEVDQSTHRPGHIAVPKRLLLAIHRFRTIGCAHTRDTLPATILDAVQLQLGCCSGHHPTKSRDLLNCGHCATDLRVRVGLDGNSTCVQIEVELWQSFGGRDSGDRDETEVPTFQLPKHGG